MLIAHKPSKNLRKPVVKSRDQDIEIIEHDDEAPPPPKAATPSGRMAAMNRRPPR